MLPGEGEPHQSEIKSKIEGEKMLPGEGEPHQSEIKSKIEGNPAFPDTPGTGYHTTNLIRKHITKTTAERSCS